MKNTHLYHLEDTLFFGKLHAEKCLQAVLDASQAIQAGYFPKVTLKVDGSPAIIFGNDKDGFFMGTKSVFNKTPKIIRKIEDVDDFHDEKPELAETLKGVFKALSQISWKKQSILQCDLLGITKDAKTVKASDGSYLVFHPNTIHYLFKTSGESGKKIIKSDIVVCIHTIYSGTSLESISGFEPVLDKKQIRDIFVLPKNIYNVDCAVRVTKDFSKNKTVQKHWNDFDEIIMSALDRLDTIPDDVYELMTSNRESFLKAMNDLVRNTKEISFSNMKNILKDSNVILPKGYRRVVDLQNSILQIKKMFHENCESFMDWMPIMATNSDAAGDTTVYDECMHEGFVVFGDEVAIKIVDRMDFSYKNFNNDRFDQ